MTRARAWIAFGLIALTALAAGVFVAERLRATSIGGDAEPFFSQTFDDLDGRAEAMTRWRGQVVVVNFWATWCAPCVEEMPLLQSIQDEYSARGVRVVGLGIDTPSALRHFRDQHRLSLPLYAAGAQGSELGRALGNRGGALPYTVLVDRNGRIVAARLGQLKAAELRRWLDNTAPAAGS
jgi:thiol-disulfide isomerase/thioredoxin